VLTIRVGTSGNGGLLDFIPTARLKSPFLAYRQDFFVEAQPDAVPIATRHARAISIN
jgi:hypothetical protein